MADEAIDLPAKGTRAKAGAAEAPADESAVEQAPEEADAPVAAETAEPEPASEPAPEEPPTSSAPSAIKLRLTHPYAFYDEDGSLRAWPHGQVVEDPAEVELLIDRKAPVEEVE